MQEFLQAMAYHVGLVSDTVAIIVIAIGSIEALYSIFRVVLVPRATTGAPDKDRRSRSSCIGSPMRLIGEII
jgi:hypothetical protein